MLLNEDFISSEFASSFKKFQKLWSVPIEKLIVDATSQRDKDISFLQLRLDSNLNGDKQTIAKWIDKLNLKESLLPIEQVVLGLLYLTQKKYNHAIKNLTPIIIDYKKESSVALTALGNIYLKGILTKPAYYLSLEIFKLAARYNDPVALTSLGLQHWKGLATPIDFIKARLYLKRAAHFNFGRAFSVLGQIEKNYFDHSFAKVREVKYYLKGIEHGDTYALYLFNIFLEESLQSNIILSHFCLRLAAEHGSPDAMHKLARIYLGTLNKCITGYDYLMRAAEEGHLPALIQLGALNGSGYEMGSFRLDPNHLRAIYYFWQYSKNGGGEESIISLMRKIKPVNLPPSSLASAAMYNALIKKTKEAKELFYRAIEVVNEKEELITHLQKLSISEYKFLFDHDNSSLEHKLYKSITERIFSLACVFLELRLPVDLVDIVKGYAFEDTHEDYLFIERNTSVLTNESLNEISENIYNEGYLRANDKEDVLHFAKNTKLMNSRHSFFTPVGLTTAPSQFIAEDQHSDSDFSPFP